MARRESKSGLWVDPAAAVILTILLLVGFVVIVGVTLWIQAAGVTGGLI